MTIKQDIKDFYGTKDWYRISRETIIGLYGPDADLFSACLAATSPRQSVKSNWKLAKKAYKLILSGQEIDGFMIAHKKNLEAIRDNWFIGRCMPPGFQLSGPKVNAFYRNLIGDLGPITVDVWMLRYFGFASDKAPTKKIYENISARVRRIAKSYNLFPAEVQAILWSAVRSHNGHKPATFLRASVDDYQLEFDFMGA
jgi:hypothetical protein